MNIELYQYNSENRSFSIAEDRTFAAKFLNEKQMVSWLKANDLDPKMPYDQAKDLYKKAAKDAGMSLSDYRSIALMQKGARNEAERTVNLQNRLLHIGEQKQLQNEASKSSNPAETLKKGQEKLDGYHDIVANVDPEWGSYGKIVKDRKVEATTRGNLIHKIDKAEKKVDNKNNFYETPGSKVIKAKKKKDTQSDFAKRVARSGKDPNKFRSKEVQDIRTKTKGTYDAMYDKDKDLGRTSGSSNARKKKNTFERQGASKADKVLNHEGPVTSSEVSKIHPSMEEKDPVSRGMSNDQKRKLKEAEKSADLTKSKLKFGTGARIATGAAAGAGIGAATTIGMKSRLMKKGYSEEEAAKKAKRAALIRSGIGAAAGAGLGYMTKNIGNKK